MFVVAVEPGFRVAVQPVARHFVNRVIGRRAGGLERWPGRMPLAPSRGLIEPTCVEAACRVWRDRLDRLLARLEVAQRGDHFDHHLRRVDAGALERALAHACPRPCPAGVPVKRFSPCLTAPGTSKTPSAVAGTVPSASTLIWRAALVEHGVAVWRRSACPAAEVVNWPSRV